MSDNNNNSTWWIWKVFIILFVITSVEVGFGMAQPEWLKVKLFDVALLNYFFIILTLVKAYYIVNFFMHLGHEVKGLRLTIYIPAIFLIVYLTALVLIEGQYIFGGSSGII